MNKFVYTVSIDGMNVKHGRATLYVIKHMSDLDKARSMIKKYYFVEFEKSPSRSIDDYYWEYDNITYTRDITLVVERVDII